MGGTNDLSNLIRLTITEHADAHLKLYKEHGNKFDYIAYMALSKQIGYEEANYMKLLGPKNWTIEGKKKLSENGKKRTGEKNGFYGKHHSEETREKLKNKPNWITNVDPKLLPYTKKYQINYPDGTNKEVYGLKVIAEEFNVSIENVHATIKRMALNKIPKRGVFSGINIKLV